MLDLEEEDVQIKPEQKQSSSSVEQSATDEFAALPLNSSLVVDEELEHEIESIEREIHESMRRETQKEMTPKVKSAEVSRSDIQDSYGESENVAVIDML